MIGNYYNHDNATIHKSTSNNVVIGSVCPKGWELPSAAWDKKYNPVAVDGEPSFYELLRNYGYPDGSAYDRGTTDILSPRDNVEQNLTAGPMYFLRGGDFDTDFQFLLEPGARGGYISKSVYGSSADAFILMLGDTSVRPASSTNMYVNHLSVRCVAK